MRTWRDSLNFAAAESAHPSQDWYNLCQKFARTAVGAAAWAPSARLAFNAVPAAHRHSGVPPAGALAYYGNPDTGNGHVALSAGGGYVWSTDIKRHGQIDKVRYDVFARAWGLAYRGWIDWTPSGPIDIRTDAVTLESTVIEGIDYSFARPNPAAVRKAGKQFVVRYISGGKSAKDLTADELASLRSAGLSVCLVWETSGGAAKGGAAQGIKDAQAAQAQVAALGMTGTPVYFAVDFDAQGAALSTVAGYIKGAASVLGPNLTGVYGGYSVIAACVGSCKWFWQTYAWSGGKWHPAAQLQQYQNGITVAGSSVDLCRATVGDYGQFPRPSVVVTPSHAAAPFTASGYRMPTHGPVVATMRQALGLPEGDQWDADVKAAWGGYLLRHPYLILAGNRSFLINKRGYASLIKNL